MTSIMSHFSFASSLDKDEAKTSTKNTQKNVSEKSSSLYTQDSKPLFNPSSESSRKRNLVLGFVGSLLIFLSSLGVGWLAPASELVQYLAMFKYFIPAQVTCIILLIIGAMMMIRAWLRLGQILKVDTKDLLRQKVMLKYMGKVSLVWTVPLMFSLPMFSRDLYAYIGQGRLMVEGRNPYTENVSTLNGYFALGPDQQWTEASVPYGPLWLYIEQIAVWIASLFPSNNVTGINPEAAIFIFRLATLGGMVLLAIYIPKIVALYHANQSQALWLVAANPALLLMFIASGHNDSLMIGLAMTGFYYAMIKRGITGVVLVALAIAIKPVAVIFLPFIGLLWAGKKASWPRKFLYWVSSACIALLILAAMDYVSHFNFGWISALSTPGSITMNYTPLGFVGFIVLNVANSLGFNGGDAREVLFRIARVVAFLIVLYEMFFGKYEKLLQRLAIAFTAVVVLSPVVHPWYIAWLVPIYAIKSTLRNDWQIKFFYTVSIFLVIVSISNQLDVYKNFDESELQLVDPKIIAGSISLLLSALVAAYFVFFDPETSKLFRHGKGLNLAWPHWARSLKSGRKYISIHQPDGSVEDQPSQEKKSEAPAEEKNETIKKKTVSANLPVKASRSSDSKKTQALYRLFIKNASKSISDAELIQTVDSQGVSLVPEENATEEVSPGHETVSSEKQVFEILSSSTKIDDDKISTQHPLSKKSKKNKTE